MNNNESTGDTQSVNKTIDMSISVARQANQEDKPRVVAIQSGEERNDRG